jgi:restriction system protein
MCRVEHKEYAMANAWVIRSGRFGERDQRALDNGVSGGGWRELPDLTPSPSREDIARLVKAGCSSSPTSASS